MGVNELTVLAKEVGVDDKEDDGFDRDADANGTYTPRRRSHKTTTLCLTFTLIFLGAAAVLYTAQGETRPIWRLWTPAQTPPYIPSDSPPDVPLGALASAALAAEETATGSATATGTLLSTSTSTSTAASSSSTASQHPISDLIAKAHAHVAAVKEQEPADLATAAARYRAARSRHPPPGFDHWFAWAKKHKSPIPESYFDQIYMDLEPFWGFEPAKVRSDAQSWSSVISVRKGKVDLRNNGTFNIANWAGRWANMVATIPAKFLPDLDMAINLDDEPHIFAPWTTVNEHMQRAELTRHAKSPNETHFYANYASYPPPPTEPTLEYFPDHPSEESLWRLVRDTCHPGLAAHKLEQDADTTVPAIFPQGPLEAAPRGYIANWTAAKSVCDNPHLRNLHGYLIYPKTGSLNLWRNTSSRDRLTTRTLFPIFSACKVQGSNNDILIPAPMYWLGIGKTGSYEAIDAYNWTQKASAVIWRGSATGGVNNATNFSRFQRHRFVSLANGTQADLVQQFVDSGATKPQHVPGGTPPLPHNVPYPSAAEYPLGALQLARDLGRWVGSWANVAFTSLTCFPAEQFFFTGGKICDYDDHWYSVPEQMKFADFFKFKYLPDVDGQSYSGRWRGFLESDSLPLKSTIWSEWHDSRLVAWKHFVPFDNTGRDLYGIMDYFIGWTPPANATAVANSTTPYPSSLNSTALNTTALASAALNSTTLDPTALNATALVAHADHDADARLIAEEGRAWAAAALRQEDMVVYTWRLVLEYARICDERREQMGYVADLLNPKTSANGTAPVSAGNTTFSNSTAR